jgi:hypothetical protein
MNLDNKPEVNADSEGTSVESSVEETAGRIAEARQELQGASNLVPRNSTEGKTDVSNQEDTSNNSASNAIVLKEIEAFSGRKFENVEDFKKHYKNLLSRNGDQTVEQLRTNAEKLAILEKQLGSTELSKLMLGIQTPATAPAVVEQPKAQPVAETKPQPTSPSSNDEMSKRLESLEHANQMQALEKKYPNATNVAKEVAIIAKSQGISYVEAFEQSPLKELVELKTKEESKGSPVVTPSNRTAVDYKRLEDLGTKVLTGKATEKDQLNFAREFFKTRGVDM